MLKVPNFLNEKFKELCEKHPQYIESIIIKENELKFDLEIAKNIFKSILKSKVYLKISNINQDIEILEEKKELESIERMIDLRASVRNLLNYNLDWISSIDDLYIEESIFLSMDPNEFKVI